MGKELLTPAQEGHDEAWAQAGTKSHVWDREGNRQDSMAAWMRGRKIPSSGDRWFTVTVMPAEPPLRADDNFKVRYVVWSA